MDTSDKMYQTILKITSNDISLIKNKLRVNGVLLEDENMSYTITSSELDKIYTLSFDSFDFEESFEFTYNIQIQKQNSQNSDKYDINCVGCVDCYNGGMYNFFSNSAQPIASNTESFMLLRTNPKLTGNIKLVVTSDEHLYIDTFKVSKTSVLNQREYRKQAVSDLGDYPADVYRVFHTLPKGELYNVYDVSYTPHMNLYNISH